MNHAQSYKIVLCFKAPGTSITNEGKFSSLKIQVNNNISSKINDYVDVTYKGKNTQKQRISELTDESA